MNDLYERRINKVSSYTTMPDSAYTNLAAIPIYVLTSEMTFSAGEEFTCDLQTRKRATVIGETTGGGTHSLDMFALGYGYVTAIPVAKAVNPVTKTNWEGVGVKPDIAIAQDQALDKAVEIINRGK